jgi:hypothetical protein
MAASRATSTSVRSLTRFTATQTRQLHMTGPSTYSAVLTSERPAFNGPTDLNGMRAECKRRNLPTNGSKADVSFLAFIFHTWTKERQLTQPTSSGTVSPPTT